MTVLQPRTPGVLVILTFVLFSLTGCTIGGMSEGQIEAAWAESPHADGESRAFTNWDDADPTVIPENCAKCHSTPGYRDFLGLDGATPGRVDHPAPIGSTVECAACHHEGAEIEPVSVMPSGAEIDQLGQSVTCVDCHQGRSSGRAIAKATANMALDAVSRDLQFVNVHNNAAGPIMYGTTAQGGYEYPDRTYAGRFEHVPQFDDCTGCHNAHTLKVERDKCAACHLQGLQSTARLRTIRTSAADYDGDGDTQEGIQAEIETLQERLLAAMQWYAEIAEGVDPIVYRPDSRPYFFTESGDEYMTWTPRLLQAAYNYHFVEKSWGHFAHNPAYTLQLLYDSLDSLGSTSGLIRP